MSPRNLLDLLIDCGVIDDDHAEAMEWRNRAACAGQGTEMFFPERGEPAEAAKRFCERCPVWRPCLEDALTRHDRWSVAGGTTEKERRVILRSRRRGQPVELTSPRARWGSGSETTREYRRDVADMVRTTTQLPEACTPMSA